MGMPGHPLSADNIVADGIVYVALGENVEDNRLEFHIELKDAEWTDVIYGEKKLDVNISEYFSVLNENKNKYYETIRNAINDASDDNTLKLCADIRISADDFMYADCYAVMISGKSLTLDLNSHELSATADATVYIRSDGALTLIDSATGGIIKNTGYAVGNYGKFTMKSGELYSKNGYALYNFNYQGTMYGRATIEGGALTGCERGIANCGILEISGGNISITDDGCDIDNSGKLIISGELVVGTMYLQDGADASGVDGKGTMTIADNAILKGLGDSWIWVEEGAKIEIVGLNNFYSLIGDTFEPENIPGKDFKWDVEEEKWVEFIEGSVSQVQNVGVNSLSVSPFFKPPVPVLVWPARRPN